jgi:hypothetical protein
MFAPPITVTELLCYCAVGKCAAVSVIFRKRYIHLLFKFSAEYSREKYVTQYHKMFVAIDADT